VNGTISPRNSAGSSAGYCGAPKDARLDGRIETASALNDHLKEAVIDTSAGLKR